MFCDLCVEEMRAGNHSNDFLAARAYKNIAEKYFLTTGLRHSRQQFKNRWQALKRIDNNLKSCFSMWLLMDHLHVFLESRFSIKVVVVTKKMSMAEKELGKAAYVLPVRRRKQRALW